MVLKEWMKLHWLNFVITIINIIIITNIAMKTTTIIITIPITNVIMNK